MCLPNILSPVFMFAFIFHCHSFSPCWPLAFLISMFFFLQSSSPLFSITHSSSFSVIHIGVNIKKKTPKKTWLCCCFFFLKVQAAMWFPSKQNLGFHLDCLTCWLSYFTLVCLWCGRTVARSVCGHVIIKFSRTGRLPHFLSYWALPMRGALRRAWSSTIKQS